MRIRTTIFALLLISLTAGNYVYANPGIRIERTFVVEASQFPLPLKKYNPSQLYLLYSGDLNYSKLAGKFLRDDTITNLKGFAGALEYAIEGFRLIYGAPGAIDSVWQVDSKFRLTSKAYPLDKTVRILVFDSLMNKTDEFIFDLRLKYPGTSKLNFPPTMDRLFRTYEVYNSIDRSEHTARSVWMLSIGIDDYGPTQYRNCKNDAESFVGFFKNQFAQIYSSAAPGILFHEYLLLDAKATRQAILQVLKDIASKAAFNDYFIFNFSGCSNYFDTGSGKEVTYFFPYDVVVKNNNNDIRNRNPADKTDSLKNCISLNVLQEHIQQIAANNQLFISEAGPSEKFKTEFIRAMMQNSPEVASILNKNRIIIVPNGFGMDYFRCLKNDIQKGPINYYITSLDSGNIYDLFGEDIYANQVAFRIKSKEYYCRSFPKEYFEIFFEQRFLKAYREIFADDEGTTRGIKPKSKELKEAANLSGKQYALVVGTDNYKGAGWKKLSNPVKDARAVRDQLVQNYGFEVQLLEDPPMDTIYKAIREYYRTLQPTDQLIIYFAGHGDVESEFMGDGFIVCSDSKSTDDDPVRNTYIQYVKLQKMINNIPARQILIMLDVCHGGVFNQRVLDERRNDPAKRITNRNVQKFLIDQANYKTRKFLSSVGTQEAFDGKAGQHSPFVKLLLDILRQRGGETNGIVTLSDIYAVLQTASLVETATLKISPQKEGFGGDDPMSEFILIPVERTGTKE